VGAASCRTRGDQTNWYLFRDEKLIAFNNTVFHWRCAAGPQFLPAGRAEADHERKLTTWMRKSFPRSSTHVSERDTQGTAYAQVDRVDDARELLRRGDRAVDAMSDDDRPRRGGRKTVEINNDEDAERRRGELVQAIAQAEARIARAERPPEHTDVATPPPAPAETNRPQEQEKLYVEVPGGWMRVEVWRLREGPREGETFVDYDEMMRIRAEREAR